jgi:hypothetical protein
MAEGSLAETGYRSGLDCCALCIFVIAHQHHRHVLEQFIGKQLLHELQTGRAIRIVDPIDKNQIKGLRTQGRQSFLMRVHWHNLGSEVALQRPGEGVLIGPTLTHTQNAFWRQHEI